MLRVKLWLSTQTGQYTQHCKPHNIFSHSCNIATVQTARRTSSEQATRHRHVINKAMKHEKTSLKRESLNLMVLKIWAWYVRATKTQGRQY